MSAEGTEEGSGNSAKPTLPPVRKEELGGWEKHTKGFGSKMLEKFGFKGRLGANENGVSRSIEVVVRPAGVGLGYGNFKESSTLKVNKIIEAEWRGIEYKDEDEGYEAGMCSFTYSPLSLNHLLTYIYLDKNGVKAKRKSSSTIMIDEVSRSQSWKKGKNNSSKVLTTQDFMLKQQEKYNSESTYTESIIDMRGESERVVSAYSELSTSKETMRPKLGQELLYNLTLTIETTENSADKWSRTLVDNKKSVETLTRQKENLVRQIAIDQPKVDNLSDLFAILNRVNERLVHTPDKIGIEDIIRLLHTLHDQYTEEFKLFGLISLCTGLSDHIFVKLFDGNWNPLLPETAQQVNELIKPWNNYVEELNARNELSLASQASKLLGDQLIKYMLPVTNRVLINHWSVVEQPNECAAILTILQSNIPFHSFQNFINSVILPKLTSAIEQWSPSTDEAAAAHLWIHPFLPFFGNSLAVIYPDIRRKLNQYFNKWSPAEGNKAHHILVPWKYIFDDVSMENLLLRSIIPKLVVGMRTFVINPANQDIATFKAVMEWGGVVANSHLLCIFLGEFFPKWLCTLSFWLQNSVPSPNLYKDIRLWYLWWKSMFPEHFLEDEDVVKYFTVALDMLEATITGKIADFQVISEYVNGYFSSKDYFYYLQSKQIVPNTYVVPEIKPLKYSSNETFKDVVEKLAADHSIDFFLTPKAHNNNQLYSFGKNLIYFDNNVIYKKIDDQSEYEPVGLQPLLAMSML